MIESTKATSDKKWFIDCNGVIRSILIDPTEQDEYVLNPDAGLVYHVAWDGGVFDEYII